MNESDVLSIAQIPKAIQIFEQVPWCAKLLNDPSLIVHRPLVRGFETYENNYDAFMSRILANPDAIRAHVTIRPRKYTSESFPRVRECVTLFDLGKNLSGHQFIAHGGVVATLLDEGLATVIALNDDVEKCETPQHAFKTLMTVYLNTTYRKPVPVPSIILCRARFDKIDGRKFFIKGTLEDDNGTVLAESESLFLEVKEKTETQGQAVI